jgi:hypothetical protein
METSRKISSVFLSGDADIRSAEVFFLKKPSSLWGRLSCKKFCGVCVLFSRRLDAKELAPVRKIFSIQDIFLGRALKSTPPSVGLRLNVSGREVDALVSVEGCWVKIFSCGETFTLPLDRHSAFVLRELFVHIRGEDKSEAPPIRFRAEIHTRRIPAPSPA